MPSTDLAADFDLADQLALVSSELLRWRIRHRPTLSIEQRLQLEALEMALDKATADARAAGIAALARHHAAARRQVVAATQAAEAALRRIRRLERVLQIAGGVLGLAAAAISGQPQDLLAAARDVKKATDGDGA